ncbi:transposase [Methylococcaceae bacterium HT5]|nr:transposase [Methylococcaceae bacterium HT5]
MTIKKTKPHAEDLRKGRYSENNRIYLVTTVTRQRQKVFSNFSQARRLVLVMRSVKGASAFQIQKIRRDQGVISTNQGLWQDGYHDHAVRKEEDLLQIARYIIANPLRAGLVKKVADYPLWDAIWL